MKTNAKGKKAARAKALVRVSPKVAPHADLEKIIGLRTRCPNDRSLRGHEVVVVAVLKNALSHEEHDYLTTDEEIRAAGGVGRFDRIEVAPIMENGRGSFVTYDPRADEVAAFASLANASR